MPHREEGTELPISVVETAVEASSDVAVFGEGMAQLMQEIETAITTSGLTSGAPIADLENIIEDTMKNKGSFVLSLENAGKNTENKIYLKHEKGGKPFYFEIGERKTAPGGPVTYHYAEIFKTNFVDKLAALIQAKKQELALVDDAVSADLGVLEEELIDMTTVENFLITKIERLEYLAAHPDEPKTLENDGTEFVNEDILRKKQVTYTLTMLAGRSEYDALYQTYKQRLDNLSTLVPEITTSGGDPEFQVSSVYGLGENLDAQEVSTITGLLDKTKIEMDAVMARADGNEQAKYVEMTHLLARYHGHLLQLKGYNVPEMYNTYHATYQEYGKKYQTLLTQGMEKGTISLTYDDQTYYVGDDAEKTPGFSGELAALDKQFPMLTKEQRQQATKVSDYLTTDPELFMTTMAAIYGNEHHSKYLEKYFGLVQKYNDGEISKIKADILALRAEREFNNKDLGTVRDARRDVKEAQKTLKVNKKREKYVRKMLRCVIQGEASERRTKMMLDIAAKVKAGNVGSNALPLPNMNFGEMSYYPQTPNDSLLWSTLSGLGYTSLDQLPKDLFDGIDMTLFPELTTVPYKMNLEGYLNPDIQKEARGTIEDDSRLSWNMESFNDAELMDRFALIVNSKDQYEKDAYPDGRLPVFQEVAKRYLAQDMNVMSFMEQYGREEGKRKELLETCLFTLASDTVIDEMRIRWFGYGAITKDDELLKEHIIGHIFVKSLIKHHDIDPGREEHIKSKLAEAFGGGWNNYEGYEGNGKVGAILNEHIASLPKKPYGGTDRGGSKWLDKSLEAKDFLYTADGSWGGINRAVNMGIIGGLTQLGISPENAAGVAGAVKLLGGGLLAFMAVKGWYNNFWKGQSFTNKVRKNALLFGGLYMLPRALTNRSFGQLYNDVMNGTNKGFVPGPLLQKFGMDAKLKTNPDAFQVEFETGIAFGPMTLGAMGKYLKHKDGKFKLEGQDLKNFLHAPETEVPRQSKEQIARLLSTCKNNERRLSEYLTQGLVRSGFAADGSNFKKLTTTDPYQTKTFEELQRSHMEISQFDDMFEGIMGSEATKTELSTRYAGLSPEEKVKATERIEEVKEFQAKRKETTPYVQFLLHRKELWPGPAGSILEQMDDAKADALSAGIKDYADKKGAHAKQYIMDPAGITSFDTLFTDGCGVGKDIASALYAADGLDKLKNYEKVAGTTDFVEDFVVDYSKDWRCGSWKRGGVDMNMKYIVLHNVPDFSGEVMVSNVEDHGKAKLSLWLKNTTSGEREEFHRKMIHDTEVNCERIGMDTDPATNLGFYMKLGTGPGGTTPKMPDGFASGFFPGIVDHLNKGETEFRVKEDWLSPGTKPDWIWDTKNTGIWKVDPDIPAKLLGPKMVFEKTGKTLP